MAPRGKSQSGAKKLISDELSKPQRLRASGGEGIKSKRLTKVKDVQYEIRLTSKDEEEEEIDLVKQDTSENNHFQMMDENDMMEEEQKRKRGKKKVAPKPKKSKPSTSNI